MPNSLMKSKMGMTHATIDESMPDKTKNSMKGEPEVPVRNKFPMNPRKIHGPDSK